MPGVWGGRAEGKRVPLPPPPCIDDFDVGQELGKGGFAVVYRARVRVSGLEVALKVVDKHRACEHLSNSTHSKASGGGGVDLACARVANEVRVHWGMKHPNVVELLDFFEDDRFVYLVLELCGRGDIYRRLRERGPFREEEAAGFMGQLLAGLAYLHERGVMHRDLKLSNLLLSEDGKRLRIGDFGLAVKLEDEDHESHTICGTPNYMAPEVQGPGYRLSADLWSAGCLFYAMVTGGAPFQGHRVGDTLANTRAGRYVEPEGLSVSARDFLACMLHLDPNRRVTVEEAAAHPFLRLDKNRLRGVQGNPRAGYGGTVIRNSSLTTDTSKNETKMRTRETIDTTSGGGGRRRGKPGSQRSSNGSGSTKRSQSYRKSSSGPSIPLLSPGDHIGVIEDRNGRGRGAASGHSCSILTVSTAPLGWSDRCSLNSSLMNATADDAVSFATMRAEAAPIPAKIGKRVAAAAARARQATLLHPPPASRKGTIANGVRKTAKMNGGGGGNAEARSSTRIVRSSHEEREGRRGDNTKRSLIHGSTIERDSVKEGVEMSHGVRLGWKGSVVDDGVLVAGPRRRDKRAAKANDASSIKEERLERNHVVNESARNHNDGLSVKNDINNSWGESGGKYDQRSGDHRSERFYNKPDTSSSDSHPASCVVSEKIQTQGLRRRVPRQPPRHRSTLDSSHEHQHRAEANRRAGAAISSEESRQCSRDEDDAGYGSWRDGFPLPSSSATVATNSSAAISSGRPQAHRRRQRQDSGRVVARPPPPLPPQPPPLLADKSRPTSHYSQLCELREVRAAAAADRCLHEAGSASGRLTKPTDVSVSVSPTERKTTSDQFLAQLSTARVKPVLHRSGSRAAVEVFPNGRAKITVGKRWLMASANGERVWAGVAGTEGRCSSITRGSREGFRAEHETLESLTSAAGTEISDPCYSLKSLPMTLQPLYRSLAGIVNALRSKTPKVVLRSERESSGSSRSSRGSGTYGDYPAKSSGRSSRKISSGLVLCALMDNLPEPDFAATFEDGASLSLWVLKKELRVELPGGRVRSWTVSVGSEWPAFDELKLSCGSRDDGGGNLDPGGGGRGSAVGVSLRTPDEERDLSGELGYLKAGFEGYCRCLREEAAAYRRGASFPVDIVVGWPTTFSGAPSKASSSGSWREGCQQEVFAPPRTNVSSAGKKHGKVRSKEAVDRGAENDEAYGSRAQREGGNNAAANAGCWWRGDDNTDDRDSSTSSEISTKAAAKVGGDNDRRLHSFDRRNSGTDPCRASPNGGGTRYDNEWERCGTGQEDANWGGLRLDPGCTGRSGEQHQKLQRQQQKLQRQQQKQQQYFEQHYEQQHSERQHYEQQRHEQQRRPRQQHSHSNELRQYPPLIASSSREERSAPISVDVVAPGSSLSIPNEAVTLSGAARGKGPDVGNQKSSSRRSSSSKARPLAHLPASDDSIARKSGHTFDVSNGIGAGNKASLGKNRGLEGSSRRSCAAEIPGLGEAFRNGRGDLEVRFCDGVVVVVDAQAKWMRVERPLQPDDQYSQECYSSLRPVGTEGQEQRQAVTYDLNSKRTEGSGGGGERKVSGGRTRMPRGVKERMKVLPRFIAILKRAPSSSRKGKM